MSDPRLILGPSGSRLQFIGGLPLMDKGLENLALISLFTRPGWAGNSLLSVSIGSDFEEKLNQPVTRRMLNEVRNAAERALVNKAFGRVTVTVTNPQSHWVAVNIVIQPPAGNLVQLRLARSGENWYYQAVYPAYPRIGPIVKPTGFNNIDIPFNEFDWSFNVEDS